MNNDTRDFMKSMGKLLIAGIIGGFIGGIFGNCFSMMFMKPHHHHPCPHHVKMMKMWEDDFSKDFEREKEFNMKMYKKMMRTIDKFKNEIKNRDDMKGEFFEEEYIIIPKSLLDEVSKNPKPFMGPKPNHKK